MRRSTGCYFIYICAFFLLTANAYALEAADIEKAPNWTKTTTAEAFMEMLEEAQYGDFGAVDNKTSNASLVKKLYSRYFKGLAKLTMIERVEYAAKRRGIGDNLGFCSLNGYARWDNYYINSRQILYYDFSIYQPGSYDLWIVAVNSTGWYFCRYNNWYLNDESDHNFGTITNTSGVSNLSDSVIVPDYVAREMNKYYIAVDNDKDGEMNGTVQYIEINAQNICPHCYALPTASS